MRFLLLLLCGLSLIACKKTRSPPIPKAVAVRADGVLELNLMSFNLRYEHAEDSATRDWRQRLRHAVEVIRREKSEIIGVQEALHGMAADLWASLPDYEFYGIGRDDGQRAGEYSGIFYQRTRFRLDPSDCGTFWLSDTPSEPGSKTWGNDTTRTAVWVRLIDLATDRGFYVFNTHWDHRSQPSREKAALLMAQRIDSRQHPQEPVCLIGDFNSEDSNPGFLHLTGKPTNITGNRSVWPNGLIDTFQALHPAERNRNTMHFWKGSTEGDNTIDHILVSKDAIITAAQIISEDQPVVSDHFPITAKVKFMPTK